MLFSHNSGEKLFFLKDGPNLVLLLMNCLVNTEFQQLALLFSSEFRKNMTRPV